MGACASTVKQWKAEADEEHATRPEKQWQTAQAGQGPAMPPVAVTATTAERQLPSAPPQQPGKLAPSGKPLPKIESHELFFRKSQELSMAHLIRHPRLHTFQQQGGRFGLDPAYQPIRLLGRGGTGQTWLCREAATGREYAVKLQQRPIPRSTVRLCYNEVSIQASTCVSSVHMTHIKEVALTPSHLALVLDYEAGGSAAEFVADQIPKVSRLDLVVDEDYARFCFRQLLAGLEHLHEHHVAHRDVKLDNTLLDEQHPPTVKLCDFQFAKYWGRPALTRMKTHLGTAVYMAPELIENRQTHNAYNPVEVDVWAAGIWLVALLLGAFPFDNRPGADDKAAEMQILHQEMSGTWTESKFVRPYIGQLSEEAIDLLNHILHINPDRRISLEGIQAHPWMQRPLPPHLEAAWQRICRSQLDLERQLARLAPDHDLVHERNSRVFDLVREAAASLEQWEDSHDRLIDACGTSSLVDCASLPGVVRIDMRPEAVAQRLSEKALSLLDGSPEEEADGALPPLGALPKRFKMPIQTIASSNSLAGMVPGGGEASSLAPPSHAGSGSGDDSLSQLSPFALSAPTLAH